jgi:hypothetical protein
MFEVLFIYPKVLARHQAGPAAVDRERYLTRCGGQGAAHGPCCALPGDCSSSPSGST